jgi:hypothetical protein
MSGFMRFTTGVGGKAAMDRDRRLRRVLTHSGHDRRSYEAAVAAPNPVLQSPKACTAPALKKFTPPQTNRGGVNSSEVKCTLTQV